ncbi:MAG: SH3 domain-containing protein [Ardenticatenaceae bacterium]|nr:SH3 domain-containing protein [Anaerolineales bacterium]MCB8922783.1 SH3 domain-containing protein [Ardenticatenaceae bacterium]MCB9004726.1 SH3 domain-containing protein [Ardenticatenaceae bacterium]
MKVRHLVWLLTIALLVLTACQAVTIEPTPVLVMPTTMAPTPIVPPLAEATLPPVPTTAILPSPTPPAAATAVPNPNPVPTPSAYRVAFVTSDDTLNVRSGPGVDFDIVGEYAPQAGDLQITGSGQEVSGSTWVPVTDGSITGWVNGRFLTADMPTTDFCEDDAVTTLLAELATAVTNHDNDKLAQLINPERGLRVRVNWWNPEVLIRGTDRANLFTATGSYDWGVTDGSGNPIRGSFANVIVPMLVDDLLPASETGCDEILSGGTAGWVQLPEGYDAIHYVSLYRPAADDSAGLDWGTWVVGVEWWNGRYTISYLVHFDWEI